MFDVFYSGNKPGLFAFEQPASSLEDAANRSKTSHYWYIMGAMITPTLILTIHRFRGKPISYMFGPVNINATAKYI